MLNFSLGKIIAVLTVLVIGFFFALPNALSNNFMGVAPAPVTNGDPVKLAQYREDLAASKESWWPGFLPKEKVNLGLDLQGGVYFLMELDPEEVVGNQMINARADVTAALIKRPLIASERTLGENATLTITLRDPSLTSAALDRIKDINAPLENSIGNARTFDVTDNGAGTITMQMTPSARENAIARAQARAVTIINRRIDPNGVSEITVVPQGQNRIILEAPGEADPQRLKDILSQAGRMTFNIVSDDTGALRAALEGRVKPGFKLLYDVETGAPYLVDVNPAITGDKIASASQGNDPDDNSPVVNFRLNSAGAKQFGEVTSTHVQRLFAIVLDDRVMSAPRINGPIWGGNVQISGSFTIEEATDLAAIIEAGELPAKLQFISERTVTATLGEDSIRAGTTASIIGLLLVAVFMVLAYSRLGIYAVASLAINIMLILGALSAIGATLTLPGIAGIILTIGMAVDANVLVFERIREEVRAGRGAMSAVQAGYEKALSTILDANITTFIAAAILYLLGSGPVKGFAVTLAYGIITSVFTAFVVTRLFTSLWLNRAKPKKLDL